MNDASERRALPPNPKQICGDKKPPVHLVPAAAICAIAEALGEGARKYGAFNWRDSPVETMTYIGGAMRHILAYIDGEDFDPDSAEGKSHLAGALASLAILVDAVESGCAIETRPPKGAGPRLVRQSVEDQRRRARPLEQLAAEVATELAEAVPASALHAETLTERGAARGRADHRETVVDLKYRGAAVDFCTLCGTWRSSHSPARWAEHELALREAAASREETPTIPIMTRLTPVRCAVPEECSACEHVSVMAYDNRKWCTVCSADLPFEPVPRVQLGDWGASDPKAGSR